jgi:holo-[acyl-carrier protein] synthase
MWPVNFFSHMSLHSIRSPRNISKVKLVACGVDIINVQEMNRAVELGKRNFLERILSKNEMLLFEGNIDYLSLCFTVKEAIAKILRLGIRTISWHEIEIIRTLEGNPVLRLSGKALKLAKKRGISKIFIWSVTDEVRICTFSIALKMEGHLESDLVMQATMIEVVHSNKEFETAIVNIPELIRCMLSEELTRFRLTDRSNYE